MKTLKTPHTKINRQPVTALGSEDSSILRLKYWFVDAKRITAPNLLRLYIPQPCDSPGACEH